MSTPYFNGPLVKRPGSEVSTATQLRVRQCLAEAIRESVGRFKDYRLKTAAVKVISCPWGLKQARYPRGTPRAC